MNFKNISRIARVALFFSIASVYSIFAREKRNRKIIACAPSFLNGNVRAIYDYMIKDQRFNDCEIYWIAHNKYELKKLEKNGINVFLDRDILRIPRFFKTGVWITDHGAADNPLYWLYVWKISSIKKVKGDSVWIDTWHGIPFKGFGRKYGDSFVNHDVLTVSSEYFKEIYMNKYGCKEEQLLITGYPRNDILLNASYKEKSHIKSIFELDNYSKVITYAPTWEQNYDQNVLKPLFPWEGDETTLNEFERIGKESNTCFIIRTHPNWESKRNLSGEEKIEKMFEEYNYVKYVSSYLMPDTQSLLLVTDVLITDWSSIANDFILTGMPMIFLDIPSPFEEGYTLGPEDRVGYIVKSQKEFFGALEECVNDPARYDERFNLIRETVLEKMYDSIDGNASERCAEEILNLIGDEK